MLWLRSGSNSDIGVVPFASNRDLNYLTDGGFRKRGSVLGYMHVGTCDLCNIVMSPSYGAKVVSSQQLHRLSCGGVREDQDAQTHVLEAPTGAQQ